MAERKMQTTVSWSGKGSSPRVFLLRTILSIYAQSCPSANSQECAVNHLEKLERKESEGRLKTKAGLKKGQTMQIIFYVKSGDKLTQKMFDWLSYTVITVVKSTIWYQLTQTNVVPTGLISKTESKTKFTLVNISVRHTANSICYGLTGHTPKTHVC